MYNAVLLAIAEEHTLARVHAVAQPWLQSVCTTLGSTPLHAGVLRQLGLAARVLEHAVPGSPELIPHEQLQAMYAVYLVYLLFLYTIADVVVSCSVFVLYVAYLSIEFMSRHQAGAGPTPTTPLVFRSRAHHGHVPSTCQMGADPSAAATRMRAGRHAREAG